MCKKPPSQSSRIRAACKRVARSLFALALSTGALATPLLSIAAPITFTQIPPGAGAREPAPNIIVSVDDSGSMGWNVNGCITPDYDTTIFENANDSARLPIDPPCPAPASAGPSRIADLRTALRTTFGNPNTGDQGIVADGRIRLAWQAMHDNGRLSRASGLQGLQDQLAPSAPNAMRPFTGAHRTNFESFIASLNARATQGGTLTHKMMANVRAYMGRTGVNGPFASVPGTTAAPELSCRRSYHILMTDGAWNAEERVNFTSGSTFLAGNFDGAPRTLPDGTAYPAGNQSQTRAYADVWGGSTGTVADWALANWATDFQPNLANNIPPLLDRASDPERVGTVTLSPYWNPKNNPMTWQGVTQYTIGFGRSATTWTGGPVWDASTDNNFGSGFVSLVNGETNWLDLFDPLLAARQIEAQRRASDLWHAALNGRGRYYPARTASALSAAFEDILKDILAQTARPLVSIASNTSRLAKDSFVYVAGFNSERWSGDVAAYPVDNDAGIARTTETWRASTLLDAAGFSVNDRVVLTHNGTDGRAFRWANLSTAQRNLLTANASLGFDSPSIGAERVNYLRGDRSKEQPATGGYMRQRESRMGSVVNSNIWFVGRPLAQSTEYTGYKAFRSSNASRPGVLYVGANDGMLHGFRVSDGKEVLAYVPRGVYDRLRAYTLPTYSFSYTVDGSPFAGDADLGGSLGWRTVLVGTLGAGGKGYFMLDVTNPASFVDPGGNASAIVLKDETLPTDADIGHIFAPPALDAETRSRAQQIVKLNNGRWAALMGNGYNSSNERPVLLIQYLDGAREIKKLVAIASTGQTNGLGAPAVYDINSNGTADVAYAGDLLGNLWKFNLVSTNDADWGVSTWNNTTFNNNATCKSGTCTPFYVATTSGGVRRPVTSAPYLMVHPQGGLQVIFGTGRDLDLNDRRTNSPPRDTVFSVWDLSTYAIVENRLAARETGAITGTGGRTRLVAQTVTDSNGRYQETSNNPVTYSRTDVNAKRGWFFDLPESRERMLQAPILFSGQTVLFSTVVPKPAIEGETCDLSSVKDIGYLTYLNGISGAPPKTQLFDKELPASTTRLQFGSGEFITVDDPGNQRSTLTPPDYFDNNKPLTCVGAECANCTQNCAETVCVGADCRCSATVCDCIGPDCACTGPNCREECGLAGAIILDVCRSRVGARTDWRELR